MFDPDNFCRTCGKTGKPAPHDCPACEGTGLNFRVTGLSMRHDRELHEKIRAAQQAQEDEEYAAESMRLRDVVTEDDIAAAEWAKLPLVTASTTPQSDAWLDAYLEWAKTREGEAPRWEDFA